MLKRKKLPSQGELKRALLYNELTGELIWRERPVSDFSSAAICSSWNNRYSGKPAFNCDNGAGYLEGRYNSVKYRAHRIAFKMFYNQEPVHIDHVNHVRSDNRIVNLLAVTKVDNCHNMSKSKRNKSGITGVTWNEKDSRWRAQIMVKGVQMHLGNFHLLRDAKKARENANVKYGFHTNHGK